MNGVQIATSAKVVFPGHSQSCPDVEAVRLNRAYRRLDPARQYARFLFR